MKNVFCTFVVKSLIATLIPSSEDFPLFKSTDNRILPWGEASDGAGILYSNIVWLIRDVTVNVPLYTVGFAP